MVNSVGKNAKGKKVDKALDLTFPASDPPAFGTSTATEPPGRPSDRKPPVITREQIEQAKRGKSRSHNKGR
jgi:hypothetical protein